MCNVKQKRLLANAALVVEEADCDWHLTLSDDMDDTLCFWVSDVLVDDVKEDFVEFVLSEEVPS